MTPPRTILLVNAGQRDVQEGGADLPQNAHRAETARLLDRVRAAPSDPHPDIGLPIIEATVRAMINAGDGPIAVAIFGTDQDDPTFAPRDTVHAAAIMSALLPIRFPADVITAVALPLGVAKANDHDAAYRAFREVFREAKLTEAGTDARGPDPARAGTDARGPSPTLGAIIGENPDAPVIIAVSSGTPAANLGALLAATETLGDRVRAIQPREDGTVARIDIAATIRRQALTQPARRLLLEGQFGTAAAFIEAWGDPRATPIARLSRALHKWQDYDLKGAIDEARNARTDLRTTFGAPIASLSDTAARMETSLAQRVNEIGPRPEPTLNQLVDLLWGADLCRAQGRYVDLVARAARLNEAILRRTASRALRLRYGASDVFDYRPDFWDGVGRTIPTYPVKRDTDPVDIPTLLDVLGALSGDGGARAVVDAARIVNVARPLHNKSIAGHAFVGVTDWAIRNALRKVRNLDAPTRIRLNTDGEGGRILIEAMARLLEAARMPAPRTNFFLDRFGVALADALAAIDP